MLGILFAIGSLFDFQPYLDRPFAEAIHNAGALPQFVDYSKQQIEETFDLFNRGYDLTQMSLLLKTWAPEFAASASYQAWEKSNYRFGIFDGAKPTHKKARLIQGINCKMCLEFCDWIKENHFTELTPSMKQLIDRLISLDQICHHVFLEKVLEISQTHPQITEIFYTYKNQPRLPISLRLIRFDPSDQYTLPLHFDISVMSLIFPSNDPPLEECLIIAPADGSTFSIDQLKRALRPIPPDPNQSCALLISGALLPNLNIPILPSPHGVLPHSHTSRYVIVACLHIPNLNTSKKDTLLPELTEIPEHLKTPQ